MHRQLKDLVRNETFGTVPTSDAHRVDLVVEMVGCGLKIAELNSYIQSQDVIIMHSNEARTIETRLRHLFARVGRLTTSAAATQNGIDELSSKSTKLEFTYDQKFSAGDYSTQSRGVRPLTPAASIVTNVHRHHTFAHQWNIYFSGDKNSLSVNAFIERVEEFRVARGIAEDELKNSVIELLKGNALSWYRSVRSQIQSWSLLVLLRRDFLPFDYEIDLWAEIRARHQRSTECVSDYFACMLNLFKRLPTPAAMRA